MINFIYILISTFLTTKWKQPIYGIFVAILVSIVINRSTSIIVMAYSVAGAWIASIKGPREIVGFYLIILYILIQIINPSDILNSLLALVLAIIFFIIKWLFYS